MRGTSSSVISVPSPTTGASSWSGLTSKSTLQAARSKDGLKQALQNYMRGRQNAKTLEYWPFTLKSFTGWFFDGVLTKMLPTMRQHSISWTGRTRTGKSLGSKPVLFAQSKFEIDKAERGGLVPSIVTAKHLDFFKAEPLTKFKPGIFDDGMLQRMDASFLKAFLNPSVL